MNNFLKINNLKKIYHDELSETLAIEDISLVVNENEFISIVGPSGCGKSTLLSILAGLEDKSSGDIDKNNLNVGYMLQSDSLFPWRTVYENCLIGLEIKNILNNKNKEKVLDLLRTYGLYEFKDKYPSSLLLDEPFSALDYQTRLTLSDDLYNIIKKENKTAIMVTHDLAEVMYRKNITIYLSIEKPRIC